MRKPRSQVLKEAKFLTRDSSWKISLADDTGCRLKVSCKDCGATNIRYAYYLKQGFTCRCKSGAKIAKASRLTKKEFIRLVPKTVRVLGKYVMLNARIKSRCLTCRIIWYPWARNLAKGHQCRCVGKDLNRATCLEKYGVEYALQAKSVRVKIRRTMNKKYGVAHALQNKELFDKNLRTAYRYKKYKLGSRIVRVQGYEPLALEYLTRKKHIHPNMLKCGIGSKALPSIPYEYGGKLRVYHPDIFNPSTNTIYEVKGEYTYRCDLLRNRAKRKACKNQGYRFIFLVMNEDGTRYDHREN